MAKGRDVVFLTTAGGPAGTGLLPSGLTVRTAAGADRITVREANIAGPVVLATGGHADTVQLDNAIFAGRVAIDTYTGPDNVVIETDGAADGEQTEFHGRFQLHTRGGDDRIFIGLANEPANSAQFLGRTLIDGGAGQDLIDAGLGETPNGNGNQFDELRVRAVP
jgi:hypothetical protein